MIEFNHVTKLYKTVIGVNDMSLDLKPGAYGLLGPNGSGKTTLINLITGQLRPTIGTVRIFGENPWKRDELLQRIGLCPAVDVLLPNVTAHEWVYYLLRLQGYVGQEAKRRTDAALELVGMSHAMHRNIGTYSLGMRQRSKLAQAISHDPDLLILDEPFNGLDPVGRHEMTEVLRGWTKEGRSFLLASHLLHEVEAVEPSFLLISGGRLLASGTPQEVRSLMVDVPREVRLRVSEPQRLARYVCEIDDVESLQIDSAAGELTVATKSLTRLGEALPVILSKHGFEVTEVRSGDGSLQQMFSSLLKIHRGEA